MGLDQYAFTRKIAPAKPVDFDPDEENDVLIAQWRKHPNLQGWMEKLYRSKGGEREFNCVPVVVTGDDLDALEKAVNADELPETRGFFFGQSLPEDKLIDLQFIKDAREAIGRGETVIYSSWW